MKKIHGRIKLAVLTLLLTTVVTVVGTFIQTSEPNPPNSVVSYASETANLSALKQELFNLTNQARASAGVQTLKLSPELALIAQTKAEEMVTLSYFDHYSPKDGLIFNLMKKNGLTYKVAGENLAGNSTAQRAHVALMNSPTHKKNIMDSRYREMGVGAANSSKYGKVFVELFMAR